MSDGKAVVNGAYEAFSRGDIDAIVGSVSEEVDWDVPDVVPHGGSFHGPDGVGQFFQGIGSTWKDLGIQIDDLIASDDDVVGVGRASGTLADGREASYGFAHVFTIRDGTIVRFREFVDPDAALS
jgi:hypothetical protein